MAEKKPGNEQPRSFFDSLMFGAPRQALPTQQPTRQAKATGQENINLQSSLIDPTSENTKEQNRNDETKQNPEIDFTQMVEQFDQLMGVVNKLGPSFKKMGPLFDMIKGFTEPKK